MFRRQLASYGITVQAVNVIASLANVYFAAHVPKQQSTCSKDTVGIKTLFQKYQSADIDVYMLWGGFDFIGKSFVGTVKIANIFVGQFNDIGDFNIRFP